MNRPMSSRWGAPSGKVRDYPDRSSAIAIVETTPGAKDVTNEIDVAPVSNFDDELRVRLARAVCGHSGFQKYALDPQGPIRIIVENGSVELAGVVLNEGDRQIAYIQANSVPGVFRVKNKLMVASDVVTRPHAGPAANSAGLAAVSKQRHTLEDLPLFYFSPHRLKTIRTVLVVKNLRLWDRGHRRKRKAQVRVLVPTRTIQAGEFAGPTGAAN